MHARRIAGQHDPQRFRPGKETQPRAKPAIQHFVRNPARQPRDHLLHLRQRRVNLFHVAPNQRVRHPRSRRKLHDVLVRTLRCVPHRQRLIRKNVRRPPADVDQFSRRILRERLPRSLLVQQIPPDQSDVRMAQLDKRFPGPMMRSLDNIQAAIRNALAENRHMKHALILPTPSECGAGWQPAADWQSALELPITRGVQSNMSISTGKQAEINITPLIDVLLVLLIIFMVILPQKSTGLDATVPQPPSDSSQPSSPARNRSERP